MAVLQRAVGNQAGSRLYINEVKEGGKTRYFVGINGDVGSFMKSGEAAHNLANLVGHKNVVEFGVTSQNLARFGGAVTFEPGEAGNQNTRVLVNPNQMSITNYNLSQTVFSAPAGGKARIYVPHGWFSRSTPRSQHGTSSATLGVI